MRSYNTIQDGTAEHLRSRLSDLSDRASRGETVATPFLTPREVRLCRQILSARLAAGTAVLVGGYPDAERMRAVLLPDYMEGMCDPDALAADPVAILRDAGLTDEADTVRDAAVLLSVRGSGYRTLSHRDFLGSVLGLGLDRDAIGDICVVGGREEPSPADPPHAYVVTGEKVAAFLLQHLEKVATDTVEVTTAVGDNARPVRTLESISDTVASPRLDCVVAALCNLSRDRAKTAIRQGLVELDYEPIADCDETVDPPAILSVRGFGKFAVQSFDGNTRKGRLRLRAGKYI